MFFFQSTRYCRNEVDSGVNKQKDSQKQKQQQQQQTILPRKTITPAPPSIIIDEVLKYISLCLYCYCFFYQCLNILAECTNVQMHKS